MTKKIIIKIGIILLIFGIGFFFGKTWVHFNDYLDSEDWDYYQSYEMTFWENYEYESQLGLDFRQRIEGLHDSKIIEYLRIIGKEVNEPDEIDPEFLDRFELLYQKWPEWLKDFAESHIVMVYIVKDLGSSGLALNVKGNDQFIICINQDIFNETPDEWHSRVESTTLEKDTRIEIAYHIESEDDPALTLENLMIHELGHAFGVVNFMTPSFNTPRINNISTPFLGGEYSMSYISFFRNDERYGDFDQLNYYDKGEKIGDYEFLNLVELLKDSPYPTIYSATSPYEYFAESFYSYVHCIIQERPFEMKVTTSDDQEIIIGNGITEARCKRERAVLETIIEKYVSYLDQ